jgi:hypothetical protein
MYRRITNWFIQRTQITPYNRIIINTDRGCSETGCTKTGSSIPSGTETGTGTIHNKTIGPLYKKMSYSIINLPYGKINPVDYRRCEYKNTV